VLWSCISVALKKIYQEECTLHIAMAEDEVLVILWTTLAVEIDVE
jgi:hypothetical protein